jgi:hypothetical protein
MQIYNLNCGLEESENIQEQAESKMDKFKVTDSKIISEENSMHGSQLKFNDYTSVKVDDE